MQSSFFANLGDPHIAFLNKKLHNKYVFIKNTLHNLHYVVKFRRV